MNRSSIVVASLVILIIGAVVVVTQMGSGGSESQMAGMDNMKSAKSGASNSMDKDEQDLTAQKEVTMDITDFEFTKPNIKIKVGTTVTWTNQDTARHNVVTDGDGTHELASVLLAKGETYSYTFTTPGMTTYLCEPHPYMKGTVHVVE